LQKHFQKNHVCERYIVNVLTSFIACNQIFTLPRDTLLYPAHDYKGFTVSSNFTSNFMTCSYLLLKLSILLVHAGEHSWRGDASQSSANKG